MQARTFGAGSLGLDGFVITVEAVSEPGEASLSVLGQGEGPLAESGRRVVAALASLGVELGRTLVHVGPAERRKGSRGLDLAIACGVLTARGVIPAGSMDGVLAWGELGPGSDLLAPAGTLLAADTAKREGFGALALPVASVGEAAPVGGLNLLAAGDLAALIGHFRGDARLACARTPTELRRELPRAASSVGGSIGSPLAWLALEVMLAGGHHLVAHGPPRSGKSGLAAGLASVPIELAADDAITLTMLHDLRAPAGLLREPSVRRVAHRASPSELAGELILAHLGVLVIDDLHDLPRASLASLRLSLEDREVAIAVGREHVRYPARARLLATIDTTAPRLDLRPVLDRVDLFVAMATPWTAAPSALEHATVDRLAVARERQRARLRGTPWRCNAEIPCTGSVAAQRIPLPREARALLADRAPLEQHRVRRVAATLADLADTNVDEPSVRLALALRSVESRIALGIEEERRKPLAHRVREGLQDAEIGVEPAVEDRE